MGRKKQVELQVETPFLNVVEAAQYMKIAKGTVYQMIHKKDSLGFPVRYLGRKPMFMIDELRQWMEQKTAS